jgi:hypothetical protein
MWAAVSALESSMEPHHVRFRSAARSKTKTCHTHHMLASPSAHWNRTISQQLDVDAASASKIQWPEKKCALPLCALPNICSHHQHVGFLRGPLAVPKCTSCVRMGSVTSVLKKSSSMELCALLVLRCEARTDNGHLHAAPF